MSTRSLYETHLTHHQVPTGKNGESIHLHVVTAGDRENPPLILLHGFPEYWRAWEKMIPSLVAAGYFVIVPDQRGYGDSSKPAGALSYSIDRLTDDLFSLVEWTGRSQCDLVAHDWGGIVAWSAVQARPERFRKFVAVNVPHPAVFGWAVKNLPSQRRKSAYIAFFQIPWLPEIYCRAFRFRALIRTLERTSRPGTFSEEDLERYRDAWGKPGALHAMIQWYRAAKKRKRGNLSSPKKLDLIKIPVLLLWGDRDAFFAKDLAEKTLGRCEHARLRDFSDGTHWIHHEEPELVASEVLSFIGQV
jgi:pimeloyl-ACP methyl ester carboxylesterase